MGDLRLGDEIDDYCVRCRHLTNHSVVSLVSGKLAKVRYRTCHNDHDYLHEKAPPSRKELKKEQLFKKALAAASPPAAAGDGARGGKEGGGES